MPDTASVAEPAVMRAKRIDLVVGGSGGVCAARQASAVAQGTKRVSDVMEAGVERRSRVAGSVAPFGAGREGAGDVVTKAGQIIASRPGRR